MDDYYRDCGLRFNVSATGQDKHGYDMCTIKVNWKPLKGEKTKKKEEREKKKLKLLGWNFCYKIIMWLLGL